MSTFNGARSKLANRRSIVAMALMKASSHFGLVTSTLTIGLRSPLGSYRLI
jgi:hypothetical protein